jgi:hypothetical protein
MSYIYIQYLTAFCTFINVVIDRQMHFDAHSIKLIVLNITKVRYWIQFLGVTQCTLQWLHFHLFMCINTVYFLVYEVSVTVLYYIIKELCI